MNTENLTEKELAGMEKLCSEAREGRDKRTVPLSHVPLSSTCHLVIYAFRNASYPFSASNTSALLVTSMGACIESTATPLSITSIP